MRGRYIGTSLPKIHYSFDMRDMRNCKFQTCPEKAAVNTRMPFWPLAPYCDFQKLPNISVWLLPPIHEVAEGLMRRCRPSPSAPPG